ncbi:hypothetical protein C7431_11152 [Pantoea allii]|uniref:Biofilm development protein YmgB/AriR n=1 Tax=Pantoea allii TaxID=574096 RepID=A0A2V2BFK5_9GAMM|nr:hypothetical protein [Pantoea allii]PWK94316.1 hypothetical protein C7431_11152 [Pantoea allii]
MSLLDEERGLVIIGEAALHLALTDREIDINSLMDQLKSMATVSCSDDRLCKIFEAISWLKKFISPGFERQSVPYLHILNSLNEGKTDSSL